MICSFLCVYVGWYMFRCICNVTCYQCENISSSPLVASLLSVSCVVVELGYYVRLLKFRFLYCTNVYLFV